MEKKPKIALCLFGLLGGTSGQNGAGKTIHPENGRMFYQKNLFDHYDTDVFIHSWSSEHKDLIIDTYNPKLSIFESQKYFKDKTIESYGFSDVKSLKTDKGVKAAIPHHTDDKGIIKYFNDLIYRTHCRWYSSQKSIQLKKEYEEKTGIKYDFVVSSRFDIALVKKIPFQNLNPNIFYASYRKDVWDNDFAFYDFTFFSGTEIMDTFGDLYNSIYDLNIRPPWAIRQYIDSLGIPHQHYLNRRQDTLMFRRLGNVKTI